MKNIEDTINDSSLPVNTIAMCNRLIEILREDDTNCALSLPGKEEGIKFRKCLWLINQQVFGQMGHIDMVEEWEFLTEKEEEESMSTKANIIVKDEYHAIQLYRHFDGYPNGPYGVIATLPQALQYSWPLPRMEADDFAAAIIRAWKKERGGNICIDGKAEIPKTLHGDIEYYYVLTPNLFLDCNQPHKETWEVEVFTSNHKMLWSGMLGEVFPDIKEKIDS